MNIISTVSPYIAPLLVFGLVVFVHELGHFIAAKMMGVYAPVFSLGWGSRMFGVRRGETDYRVSMIPLGGYVRMASRDDESMAGIEGGGDRGSLNEAQARPSSVPEELWSEDSMAPFGPKGVPADRWVENKSTPARVFIMSAGVMMNILLTLFVSSLVFFLYGNIKRPDVLPAVLDQVVASSAAEKAGLKAGDRIVSIDGQRVESWTDVTNRVSKADTGSLQFEVQRSGAMVKTAVSPVPTEVVDPLTGRTSTVGRIGVAVRDSIIREPVGLIESIGLGGRATWAMTNSVFSVLGGLVTGQVSAKNLGGPIAIARTSVQAARSGAETLWSLIAFLSINIAILNLVPIPVLDGGQILFVLLEKAKGSEFSVRTREMFARVGVLAVLALLVLVMFNDVRALFTP